MTTITVDGATVELSGNPPKIGDKLDDHTLIRSDFSEMRLATLKGKAIVLNIFPSIGTPVCQSQLRTFAEELANENVHALFVSLDLPTALSSFCAAEGLDNSLVLSDFKYKSLEALGLTMKAGPLDGLYARATIITDENLTIHYIELVSEIGDEPDYKSALNALQT